MPRQLEIGVPALYKYQEVKYYHFKVPPGTSYILTADPWSFLTSWISQGINSRRGRNNRCLKRAEYYSRLASEFYKASNVTEFPVKATLVYYGMLNLVKSYISVNSIELEKTHEYHGLTIPKGKKNHIEVLNPGNSSEAISIFSEFSKLLQAPVDKKTLIDLNRIVCNIPELHEMAFSLGLFGSAKRKFLPVSINFLTNQGKNKLFTEIKYDKKHEARVKVDIFLKGARKDYFKKIEDNSASVKYRSKRRKSLTKNNYPVIYKNIQKEYNEFDIVSLLTSRGYKYYCDLKPGDFHHLCYSFLLLFYLGSVARYRPSEVEELMSGRFGPLISEAITVIPMQFLYQLVSHTTSNVCVVPQAKLF